ncbi:MAG: hypothetical protein ACYS0G_02695 [Planctomycetota bacterium]|jgi:hypothetical protein
MKGQTLGWTIIFVVAAIYLVVRASTGIGMGKAYVKAVPQEFVNVAAEGEAPNWIEVSSDEADAYDVSLTAFGPDTRISWTDYPFATAQQYAAAMRENPNQTTYRTSFWRTVGVWIAALFTLAIFSFLWKDNPFYKIAEAAVVGVSAAYWMVVAFHTILLPNLFGKIWPEWIQSWAMPGLKEPRDLYFIVPLILGAMLLWRLAPKWGWISRWPLAFFIGVFCGLRLMGYMHADFLNQIRNAIVPLVMYDNGSFDFWESLRNLLLVGGVLACLVYFFFSFEHKGFVGKTAKVGIWILMITFGAGFGYTVMGRIALLAIRLEFLFDDWLWLIDPTGKRLGM